MKLYLAILSLLVSGIAQADALVATNLFEDPARILLTLAEVSVALTAFSGIAIVIGRRAGGQWTETDQTRFGGLVINGVLAVLFCLLPFLIINPVTAFTEVSWNVVLFWAGGIGLLEVQWRVRRMWMLVAKRLDEDSRLLPIMVASLGVLVYVVLFLVAFDIVDILEFRMLIFLIMWHLFTAVYGFLRMIRHSGVNVSNADN